MIFILDECFGWLEPNKMQFPHSIIVQNNSVRHFDQAQNARFWLHVLTSQLK